MAQQVLHFADVELETSIDDAGKRVYRVICATFTLPADPPPSAAGLPADPAAELLRLAARIYTANQVDVSALADRVIACAMALEGRADHRLKPSQLPIEFLALRRD